jgi:chromosome partitioning protein
MTHHLQGVFTLAGTAGGTGCTTLALSIATLLAQRDVEVLLIDLDPRGCLSSLAGLEGSSRERGVLHALGTGQDSSELISPTGQPGLSILASDIRSVAHHAQLEAALADWRALPRMLEPLRATFQAIIIDTPPGLGRVARAAITASDEVIVPLVADPMAVRSLPRVLEAVVDARQVGGSQPRLAGVCLNRIDPGAPLFRQVVEDLTSMFHPLLLDTAIPQDPWFVEAAARAIPLPLLLPEARGLAAVSGLIDELSVRLA